MKRIFALVLFFCIPLFSLAATTGYISSFQVVGEDDGGFDTSLGQLFRFGFSVEGIGDFDGDGIYDLAVGATGDGDGGSGLGSVHLLFLNTDGTVKSTSELKGDDIPFIVSGGSDFFGSDIATVGDLDGDDVTDLVVGVYSDDEGGGTAGAAVTLFLNSDGSLKGYQKISSATGTFPTNYSAVDSFGRGLDDIGDIDGDGLSDIAIGAPGDDDGGGLNEQGAVYISFMTATGSVSSSTKISATTTGFGSELDGDDNFGFSVAGIGDVDGDDVEDVAVGAYLDDDGGTSRGAVYILFLNSNGSLKSYQKISDTAGDFTATLDNGDQFGYALGNAGDINNDGVNDLLVTALGDDDGSSAHGAVYILFLNTDGTVKKYRKISKTEGGFSSTVTGSSSFGSSITSLGDLDGDGNIDITVGAFAENDALRNLFVGEIFNFFTASIGLTNTASIQATESGGVGEVVLTLDAQPLSQVDFALTLENGTDVSVASGVCLTATTSDTGSGDYAPCSSWDSGVTIAVSATDDSDAESDEFDTLTLTASSSDSTYDTLTSTSQITIKDNDGAGENSALSGGGTWSGGGGGSSSGDDDEEEDTETPQSTEEQIALLKQQLITLILEVLELLQEQVATQQGS